MPSTPHPSLRQINLSKPPNAELTPYQRGQIHAASHLGLSPSKIATSLGFNRDTVRKTIRQLRVSDPATGGGKGLGVSKPRSGRPGVLSEDVKERIRGFVRGKAEVKAGEVIRGLELGCSARTVSRFMKGEGEKGRRR